jgi:subtilisin family serine protease
MILSKNRKVSLLPYIQENVYGLNSRTDQITGWEINKLNIKDYWQYGMGEGVKIAVIDSGCDLDHPDLKPNLLNNGYNFIDNNDDPSDDNGHGSHVAGTIAACNNGVGIVGVAPKAKILPVKSLDADGSGSLQSVAMGILWAVEQGVDMITMSLGCELHSKDFHDVIKFAHSKGILIFCAAGNSGFRNNVMYPARYPETISIAAIDSDFKRTDFSCAGKSLDFLAPGHDILSCIPDDAYAKMSGTSMSNPFAVGCVALGMSALKRKLTKKSMIELYSKNAISLNDPMHRGKKMYEGNGIIVPINPSHLHN